MTEYDRKKKIEESLNRFGDAMSHHVDLDKMMESHYNKRRELLEDEEIRKKLNSVNFCKNT